MNEGRIQTRKNNLNIAFSFKILVLTFLGQRLKVWLMIGRARCFGKRDDRNIRRWRHSFRDSCRVARALVTRIKERQRINLYYIYNFFLYILSISSSSSSLRLRCRETRLWYWRQWPIDAVYTIQLTSVHQQAYTSFYLTSWGKTTSIEIFFPHS